MTALPQYVRLESSGLWRENATDQNRDVIVAFGDATVVISDATLDLPLTHWSLAALERRNPGRTPAIYGPIGDDQETLTIEDTDMIGAIEKVMTAIESGRPHPGRLRGALTVIGIIAILTAVGMWLPNKLMRQAAGSATEATRQSVGREILTDMIQRTGQACKSSGADAALAALQDRLPGNNLAITVVPGAVPNGAMMLPGNIIITSSAMLKGANSPDAMAGAVVTAEAIARQSDPFRDFIEWAGPQTALKLLVSGEIPQEAVSGYGLQLLDAPPALPSTDTLIAAFTRANIASSDYATVMDPDGNQLSDLITSDPFKDKAAPIALLREGQWNALKRICN